MRTLHRWHVVGDNGDGDVYICARCGKCRRKHQSKWEYASFGGLLSLLRPECV